MTDLFSNTLYSLEKYCSDEDFAGWDPYDGLNSKFWKALPLVNNSAICRLVWIQGFKRFPFNLRKLLCVPKQHNAKAIGLFLHGYCNLVKYAPSDEYIKKINYLADKLISMRSTKTSGAAWGYNFPWQCRREFLFPAGEPTVVATWFCASALFEAYEITGRTDLRDIALSSAQFVLKDLRRTPHKDGFIFSYSMMPGNDTIYNASLLGAALLALCYKYSGNQEYLNAARASVTACCADQADDGSWTYGVAPVTGWKDSFHTGYNLEALKVYQECSGDMSFNKCIDKGVKFYVENFFKADGAPKYYHNRQYPIDIHCPGELPIVLYRLGLYNQHKKLIDRVIKWTIDNMFDKRGFFYYQMKQSISSRISYMRWSNAFMFSSLTTMLLANKNNV